jgi:hypothetical protein
MRVNIVQQHGDAYCRDEHQSGDAPQQHPEARLFRRNRSVAGRGSRGFELGAISLLPGSRQTLRTLCDRAAPMQPLQIRPQPALWPAATLPQLRVFPTHAEFDTGAKKISARVGGHTRQGTLRRLKAAAAGGGSGGGLHRSLHHVADHGTRFPDGPTGGSGGLPAGRRAQRRVKRGTRAPRSRGVPYQDAALVSRTRNGCDTARG